MPPRTRRLTLLALAAAAFCVPAALPAVASAEDFGDIVINEFRTHGPNGATDEFIELLNTTSAPINLKPSGSNRMWVVEYWVPDSSAVDGGYWEYFYFDDNRTIPANSRLLLVNRPMDPADGGGYSLDSYEPANYPDDLPYDPIGAGLDDIPTTHGITLWSDVMYDSNFNLSWDASSLDVDEAGFGGDILGDGIEGTPLPSHGTDTGSQYSYVRKAPTGVVQDTDDNASDFVLVGLDGDELANGLDPVMGAPGPQGVTEPRENFRAGFNRIDATKALSASPNRVFNSTPDPSIGANAGTLTLNRTLVNNTGAPINTLRIRWINLTTRNSPGSSNTSQAILKPVSAPATSTVATASGNKTAHGFQLEQPMTPPATNQGGLNSSMTLAIPGGTIPAGGTVNVQIKLAVERNGTYTAAWWPEVG